MSIAAHIVGTRLVGPRQTVAVVTQSASDLASLFLSFATDCPIVFRETEIPRIQWTSNSSIGNARNLSALETKETPP